MFALKLEASSDEAAVRIYGEFALLGLRIYQEFQPRGIHGCKSFEIPANWTRYISIDPGRQARCALSPRSLRRLICAVDTYSSMTSCILALQRGSFC